MTYIWKYELELTNRQTVRMPNDAKLLSVANQRSNLCLWAMVDSDYSNEIDREIEIVGTGHTMSEERRSFIGTAVIGPFVWHVFELTS